MQSTSEYTQSIKTISQDTKLTSNYITKCRNSLPDLFKGTFIQDPEQGNSYFFNDEGLAYLRQISNFKSKGKNLSYIKKVMRKQNVIEAEVIESGYKEGKSSIKMDAKIMQNTLELDPRILREQLKHKDEIAEQKSIIGEKDVLIEKLRGDLQTAKTSLLLIGAPERPEELTMFALKKAQDVKASTVDTKILEVIELLAALDNQFFVGRKRKQLARKLKELKAEREALYEKSTL